MNPAATTRQLWLDALECVTAPVIKRMAGGRLAKEIPAQRLPTRAAFWRDADTEWSAQKIWAGHGDVTADHALEDWEQRRMDMIPGE